VSSEPFSSRRETPSTRTQAKRSRGRGKERETVREKHGHRAKPRRRERWRCARGIRRRCQGRRASSLVSTQPGHGQPGRTSRAHRQHAQRTEATDAGRRGTRETLHQGPGEYVIPRMMLRSTPSVARVAANAAIGLASDLFGTIISGFTESISFFRATDALERDRSSSNGASRDPSPEAVPRTDNH